MKKIMALLLFPCLNLLADTALDNLKEQLVQQQKIIKILQNKVSLIEKNNAQKQNIELEKKMALNTKDFSSSFSQKDYAPDISMILNMSAVGRSLKNSDYQNFAIPGFIDAGDEDLLFSPDKGFNLNYAEISMHSAVDPYFDAYATFHIRPDSFEVDEAYIITRALSEGFRIKAGKFRSNFGYINEKHNHSWYFSSQPIIYQTIFGQEGIIDTGIQVQYLAPTDTYLMFGIEAMQGANTRSFGDVNNGNSLYVAYLKSSIDIGDDLSVLGGLSIANGKNIYKKETNVYGVDLVLREQLASYSSLVWQSEYLYRDKQNNTPDSDKQAGFYSELIFNYNKDYALGIMYDSITKNKTDLSIYTGLDTNNLNRYTAMVQYKPFEFSRLRLQYTYDKTKIINGERKNISEIMLELNIAAGAHSAHSY
ncbi:MAG: hypothetical protein COB17_07250 [Sulfurimonas sp.]|nr:MAG: hypothetical protein COB17_07250 [Sulfurimonas sp.]